MNRRNLLYKSLVILLIITVLGNLISCSPQLKPSPKASEENEEKEPPKELEELRKSIEKIEKALMSMHEDKKKAQQGIISSQSSEGGQEQEGEQEQGGQQGQESQQGGQQDQQQEKKSEEQIQIQMSPEELEEYQKQQEKVKLQEELGKKNKETLEKFEGLKKDVLELHGKWNSFEPKAVIALAPQKSMEDFENALNNLTDTIQIKDEYVNLLSVNLLYKILPDFYELYKTKEPPDLDRLRYGVKKIRLVAEKDDYNSMKPTLEYLISVWAVARPKLKKDSIDLMNKFEFALNDLKKSVENKNKVIIDAKADVLIKIIDEIVESLKD